MSSYLPELLSFPCRFPIKVLGMDEDDFIGLVVEIVERHVGALPREAVSSRLSSSGRYRAVTLTIEAHSHAQLDGIYRELSAHERVIMAL
jgi:hypothetical protein